MKARHFAQLLDQMSRILKLLPDMELQTALSVIEQKMKDTKIVSTESNADIFTVSESPFSSPPIAVQPDQDVVKQLEQVPTEDLETFIRKSPAGRTKATLKELADQLGVECNMKQKKDDMINLIVAHFESQRMHAAIRTYSST